SSMCSYHVRPQEPAETKPRTACFPAASGENPPPLLKPMTKTRSASAKSYLESDPKAACQPSISAWKSACSQTPSLSPTPGLSIRTVAKPDSSIRRRSKMPNPSRVAESGYSIESQLSQPTKKITGTLPEVRRGRVVKVRSLCPLRFVTQS